MVFILWNTFECVFCLVVGCVSGVKGLKLLPQYPKVQHLAIALDKRVEKIIEEEKKDQSDLFTLATR